VGRYPSDLGVSESPFCYGRGHPSSGIVAACSCHFDAKRSLGLIINPDERGHDVELMKLSEHSLAHLIAP